LKQRQTAPLCEDIAAKLPGRNRLSVQRHIINRYCGDMYTRKWTPQDDETLRRLFAELGSRWEIIGNTMDRSATMVRLRWQDHVSLKDRKTGTWNAEECKRLHEIVLNVLRETKWTEKDGLEVDKVSKYINWGVISKNLGDRSRLQCRAKWVDLEKWQHLVQE
jgi:Myb-like DNA-binding domain